MSKYHSVEDAFDVAWENLDQWLREAPLGSPQEPQDGLSLDQATEAFLPGCKAAEALPDFDPWKPAGPIKSDGGSTSYYKLPSDATELNDLIEHKGMGFARGNIFKACYRMGEKDGADALYDINKIIFFAERMRGVILKGGRV